MTLPQIAMPAISATLLISCGMESTERSDLPLPSATVARMFDMPLPKSAHSVYYLQHAGGMQDLEFYLRFDVDPSDIHKAADDLVTWNKGVLGKHLAYPRAPLSASALSTPRIDFQPMPWWDPSSVTTGYYRGSIEAYALQIIVDEGRSRIYLYQND